ncbi:transmembrane protein 176 [Myripristis murdjan]|uniref:transmembrane protein 176 n=1 Tax=Myripristis murdjan TaxID=586833 RepID=UPI0011761F57|nr:membrane-spanning 4-domains subfamily A member 12-like [Myripristis murdjan]
MAVSISRDLSVHVLHDVNASKLTDRQQALRASVQKGEPKCLGVSQVMLGVMVMSYSIPLIFTEITEVVRLGVPWWSGLSFIISGVVAIVVEKHCSMKTVGLCIGVSVVSIVLSVVALIVYSVDLEKNPESQCVLLYNRSCDEKYYAVRLSRGVKSSLLLFTLVQTVISSTLCYLLYTKRRSFGQYASLNEGAPATPTTVTPPDMN